MIFAGQAVTLQKAASIGILGAVLAVFALFVATPVVQTVVEDRDAVMVERDRLDTLQTKRRDLAALEATLKSHRAASSERPFVLEAPNSAAAWEKIEQALRDTAAKFGAAVTLSRALRIEDEAGLKALRMEITLQVPRTRLSGLLAAIEDQAPLVFVEKLRVAAQPAIGDRDQIEMAMTIRVLAVIAPPQVAKT